MHAVDLIDPEAVHQPVLDHGGGARAALLGRLEDHHRVAGEVAGLGEIARRAEQHRGVAVMAAGVHLAGDGRGIGQIGLFLDRQRVHVGAQPDHLDLGARGRLAALDHADHAGAADAGRDLVATERPQPLRDESRGAVHVVHHLGMRMHITAPRHDVRLQIGDTIDDGHGSHLEAARRCGGTSRAVLVSTAVRSAQYPVLPPAVQVLYSAGRRR